MNLFSNKNRVISALVSITVFLFFVYVYSTHFYVSEAEIMEYYLEYNLDDNGIFAISNMFGAVVATLALTLILNLILYFLASFFIKGTTATRFKYLILAPSIVLILSSLPYGLAFNFITAFYYLVVLSIIFFMIEAFTAVIRHLLRLYKQRKL